MPEHRADEPEVKPPTRTSRRVRTEPPAGSDPHPEGEAPRHRAEDNDETLKRDVPPHWS